MKRILVCILIILFLALQVSAEESELEKAVQNMKEQFQIVDEVQKASLEARKQVLSIEAEIQNQEQTIKEIQTQLDEFNQSLKEQEDTLKIRIRQIYMLGSDDYNEILFGDKTFLDAISINAGIKNIHKADSQLIKSILNTRKKIKETIETLSQLEEKQLKTLNKKKLILIRDNVKYKVQKTICNKELSSFNELAQKYGKNASDYHFDVNLQWPVDDVYLITSPYGWRVLSLTGSDFHTGIDIGANSGMPVRAVANGTVEFSGWYNYGGNCVIINHGADDNGVIISSLYAHLSMIAVTSGEVSKGDIIGYVGSTGLATGPHLHLEIMENGNHTNPLNYFN